MGSQESLGATVLGKSTIVEAIAWALYGNRASTIKRDLIKNSRASDSDLVEVKLNLGMGTQDLTIYRAMKGKGLMPDAALFIGPNRVASGSREVDMRLEEILDISYQDFMKTFYARQKDLDNLLKEGGAGKREYLLKLLSLDDIKERAIEEIKQDRADLEGRSMVLTGALSEIGDVEDKIQETVNQISSAMSDLSLAEKSAADLASILEMRKLQLEVQAEKAKSYSLLSERASALERSISEKKKAASEEETRLKAIELSKKALSDLDPGLKRLKEVKARLEALEPVRKRHDEISRKIARSSAELDREQEISSRRKRAGSSRF
jgi:exonuclease SbcC